MTTYQIAFLFCRVVGTFFLWKVLFSIFNTAGAFVESGFMKNFILTPFVTLALGLFVRASATTFAAFIVGQNSFAGESLSQEWTRTPRYRALHRTLVGALLLIFGALYFSSSLVTSVSFFLSDTSSTNELMNDLMNALFYFFSLIAMPLFGAALFFFGASAHRKLAAGDVATNSDSSQPL